MSTNPMRAEICELMSVNLKPLKTMNTPVIKIYAKVAKSIGYMIFKSFLQGIF